MRGRLAAAGVVAVAVATMAAASCGSERDLVGFTRDPAPQVDAVALPDVSRGGEPFPFRAVDDGVLVVFFGFTNCPDICPTTMADLRTALDDLGDDAERVDVAMVTVDPARDTPVLAEYVQSFVDDAHALATDDDASLQAVAEPFGVSYSVQAGAGGDVEVGHSSYLFAVDEAGTLVLTWPAPTAAGDLAADLRQLLAEA